MHYLERQIRQGVDDWCTENDIDSGTIQDCITVIHDEICINTSGMDFGLVVPLNEAITKIVYSVLSEGGRRSAFDPLP